MSGPERENKDQLWSEATLWFARMRSPDAEQFRPAFEEWLARGALHRRYYNRASEYWVDSGTALQERDDRSNVGDPEDPSRKPRKGRGAAAALAAVSALVAGSAILTVVHDRRDRPASAPLAAVTQPPFTALQFETTAAAPRAMRLADGSNVTLARDTLLRVGFGAAMRRLEVTRGEVRFEVAHEARPFVVLAGGGSVTARGTLFDVAVLGRRVSVTLIRGSVDLRLPQDRNATPKSGPLRLHPGERVSFAAMPAAASAAPQSTVRGSTQASLAASRDYRDIPLADIIQEADRQAGVPIRFADPKIATKTVSGRFRTDDTALLAERIAALFDLAIDRRDPSAIVLSPKQP